jgi:N-acetylneuraminic acid mutarotase
MDPRGTVFALNSTANSWTKLANMPTPRGGISVAAVGTKIYTFGGEGNRAPSSNGVFSECESYDASRDAWTKEVTMKTPRHGMGAIAIGGSIYLPGGGSTGGGGTPLDTNEAFIPGNC